MSASENIDKETVEGFGHEWGTYDQNALTKQELNKQFERYFSIFPWGSLPKNAKGFDMGCGSGRWAACVVNKERVEQLVCIDASPKALSVAKNKMQGCVKAQCLLGTFDDIPLLDESMDFGYSLGVLHHIPNTFAGIKACAKKLKPGAPFLLYIYYAFDQRPWWFKMLWRCSDIVRKTVSKMPFRVKNMICQLLALMLYWPLSRLSKLFELMGCDVDAFPLSAYRDKSFYTMRTDSLDRFGTRLEQRFTKPQIVNMMEKAGFEKIKFSDSEPYWCAVGYKKT